ncbi:MAG TPA: hypothetical protein VGL57_00840 [Solirubrobacteraceae bacterium]|jgi:hypothetical protein
MTDTFASESSASREASAEGAQQSGDLTGALAGLERKLRELEQELTSIGGQRAAGGLDPAPAPSAPAPAAATSQSASPPAPNPTPAPNPSGRLIDEAVEPASPPVTAQAPERVRPSDAQLASLAELRRFRDRLERFARELAAEYDALLGRVMTGLSTAPAPAAAPQPAPPVAPPPPPEPTPAEARENALFEGRVELGVGPFYDIASLGAFERSLAGLQGVSEASVRRFEASHAVVDVHLSAPVALVRELRRAVESDFDVREVASGRILLTFDES